MNKKTSFILVAVIHVSYIFLQINKQNKFIKLSYENQRLERQKKELLEYKQTLIEQRCALNQQGAVKAYAIEHLGMKPLSLSSIITFTSHE